MNRGWRGVGVVTLIAAGIALAGCLSTQSTLSSSGLQFEIPEGWSARGFPASKDSFNQQFANFRLTQSGEIDPIKEMRADDFVVTIREGTPRSLGLPPSLFSTSAMIAEADLLRLTSARVPVGRSVAVHGFRIGERRFKLTAQFGQEQPSADQIGRVNDVLGTLRETS